MNLLPVLPPEGPVLVSACLAGRACTYRATDNTGKGADAVVRDLVATGRAVLVCPEVDGGLPTPRPPAEVTGGTGLDVLDGSARVLTDAGEDVTDNYLRGARRAAERAQTTGATAALLKARSPSCGVGRIYDGTHAATLTDGDGVTAALLRRVGVTILTEEDLT